MSDVLAFLAAYTLGGFVFWHIRHSETLSRFFVSWATLYLLILPVGIAWFYLKGHYTRRWPFWDELRGVTQVLIALVVVDGALIFLTKSTFPRIWFISTALGLFLFLPALRLLVKNILLCAGKWRLPTVIVGSGGHASEVLAALLSERLMGFDVRFFWTFDQQPENEWNGIPVRSIEPDIVNALRKEDIRCVVVALDDKSADDSSALMERLHLYTLDLYVVPAMRGIPLHGMEIHHFFRHEVIMMRVRNNLLRPVVRFFKRTFDIFGSITLLCLLSPLLLAIGFLVSKDGGPVLFGHNRIGWRGASFKCLKFRSMVTNADSILEDVLADDSVAKAEWDADFKLKKDPRVTRTGAFLRKFSLDELPQLWNVLKGEMSLVGPRPLVEKELERYGEQLDYYLQVRPGMTGLWQVSGRNDVDYSHRVYLDAWYVKNWSLWYDIAILFKTFKVIFGKEGAY